MRTEIQTLCGELGAATLTGLYQGIVVTIMVGVFLRFLVRTNATTRHAVWFASLLLVVAIVPAHFWLDRESAECGAGSGECGVLDRLGDEPGWQDANGSPPFALELDSALVASRNLGESPESERIAEVGRSVMPGVQAGLAYWLGLLDRLYRDVRFVAQEFLQPVSWNLESERGFRILGVITALVLVAGAMRLMMLFWRLWQLQSFTEGSGPASPELQAMFERLRVQTAVRRKVRLRISLRQRCPVLLGFFRPVILLPHDLAAHSGQAETEHVLRHELAHARRYDDWANLVQHVIQALVFFHPAVWWIAKRLSLEREIACDDHVLDQSAGRRNYALILANVASRIHQRTPLLAPGVSNSNSQLQQRISMILNTRRNSSPSLAKGRLASILTVAALLAALALLTGPRFVMAQTTAATSTSITTSGTTVAVEAHPSVTVTSEVSSPEPVVVVAQAGEPGPAVASVDPGPKFKPEVAVAEPEPAEFVEMSAPEPPDAPPGVRADRTPRTPRAARAAKPAKSPKPPGSLYALKEGDGSIEERLQRLENMMNKLMDQSKRQHGMIYFKDGNDQNQNLNSNKQDAEKMQQSAERQAARAAEQAQRAVEQANRATKDLEARLEQDQSMKGEFRENFQKQLEALRKAREGLGKEMEKLDRKIQKLENEQEHGDKNKQRRGEVSSEKLQAQSESTSESEQ